MKKIILYIPVVGFFYAITQTEQTKERLRKNDEQWNNLVVEEFFHNIGISAICSFVIFPTIIYFLFFP